MQGSYTVCPPACIYSDYLEVLSDRKGRDFRRGRANKFLRSAVLKGKYSGDSPGGDGEEIEKG